MPYVYSTLTADQEYALYPNELDPKSIAQAEASIFIAGKANVLNPKTFLTPKGMCTSIGEEELVVLEKIPAFLRHKEAGYITVERKEAPVEKVVKNMTSKDSSAQLVAEDFAEDRQPKVNTDE